MIEGALLLPGGRRLAWRESGPATGRPVLHFHGSASSRLEPAPDERSLERLDVRLVQPDRPGYGGSDRQEGRSLRDWAADCRVLAERLGCDRVAVSGWSAGAVHALGCAAHAPDLVSAAALVAAPGPLVEKELARCLPADCRRALALARRAPLLLRIALSLVAPILRARPEHSLRWFENLLPDDERARLAQPELRARWLDMVREAWRQGGGGLWDEGRILVEDWDFELGSVRRPVQLWHGEADRLTPPEMARRLAAELPHARLRMLPGEGHALWLRHGEEILAELVGARRA